MGSGSLDAMGNSHGEVIEGTGTEVIAVIIPKYLSQ